MVQIVYTLGNPKGYDPDLAEARRKREPIFKLGRTEDYSGGIVFKTPEEARAYSSEHELGYEPYGLMLPNGWNTDVDSSRTQEDYDCLLNNAEIITLEEVRQGGRILPDGVLKSHA